MQTMGAGVWQPQWARKLGEAKKNSAEGIMRLEDLGGFTTASQVQGESRGHDRLRSSWRDKGG